MAKRTKQVKRADFIRVFQTMAKKGATREEIAEALGMDIKSFGPRLSQVRTYVLEKYGRELVELPSAKRGPKVDLEAEAALIDDLFGEDENEDVSDELDETDAEGETDNE
jgi:hypothetical protein